MDPMLLQPRIHFVRSDAPQAVAACEGLVARYGQTALHDADVIVALGGDGLMLEVLQASRRDPRPVYGMHRGTVGFLMNDYIEEGLMERLMAAEAAVINPLKMTVECDDGEKVWADAAELEKADDGGGAADAVDDYNEDDIPF